MNKKTISLAVGIAVALFSAQVVHARGFGGARGCTAYSGGAYHSSSYHEGGSSSGAYHESGYHEGGAYAKTPEGAGAVHSGSSSEVYHGPGGTTVAHGTAGVQGAATGPGGAAAGGKAVSGTAVKGPEGNEYTHETSVGRGAATGPGGTAAGGKAVSGTAVKGPEGNEYAHETTAGRGVATGPEGTEAGRYGSSTSAYHGAEGGAYAHGAESGAYAHGAESGAYAHGAVGYGTVHTALPTDAGYGAPAARTATSGYAGYHQTTAVNGNVASRARGLRPERFQLSRPLWLKLAHREPNGLEPGGLVGRASMEPRHLAECRCVAGLRQRRSYSLQLRHEHHLSEQSGLL